MKAFIVFSVLALCVISNEATFFGGSGSSSGSSSLGGDYGSSASAGSSSGSLGGIGDIFGQKLAFKRKLIEAKKNKISSLFSGLGNLGGGSEQPVAYSGGSSGSSAWSGSQAQSYGPPQVQQQYGPPPVQQQYRPAPVRTVPVAVQVYQVEIPVEQPRPNYGVPAYQPQPRPSYGPPQQRPTYNYQPPAPQPSYGPPPATFVESGSQAQAQAYAQAHAHSGSNVQVQSQVVNEIPDSSYLPPPQPISNCHH